MEQPEAANTRRDRRLRAVGLLTSERLTQSEPLAVRGDDEDVAAGPPLLRADQAEPRYNEALQTAVAACAEDTEGQTCFICMDGAAEEGLVRGCACRGGAGFAHVSCLARQAQVEVERDIQNGWKRWHTCRQCEQKYHGVVECALGWACWKTYVGRPETQRVRLWAMTELGNGLSVANQHEDALSVKKAELSMLQRLDAPEENILVVQNNLANTYESLGRVEEAVRVRRDVYSGRLKILGDEHSQTLSTANNYAATLIDLERFEEAKTLLLKTMPVARRVLGENHELTLWMREAYAAALCDDTGATLDDLREAVTTLEDAERTARRVLGGSHPTTTGIERNLQITRAALRARETPPRRRRVKTQARMATRGIRQ